MTQKSNQETADSQASVPAQQTLTVADVTTWGQWNQMIEATERAAGDLVASPIVRDGYLAHGHPADLGFIHLNSMTSCRIRKRFPLAVKEDPLFAMLYAQGKLIVGQGLVKKYEARSTGKKFDHLKWIDKKFDELFNSLGAYREALREIAYNADRNH